MKRRVEGRPIDSKNLFGYVSYCFVWIGLSLRGAIGVGELVDSGLLEEEQDRKHLEMCKSRQ